MIFLHDRYAIDGFDPSIPWQERPIFGMTRLKTGVDAYLREIAHLEVVKKDPFAL